MKKTKILLGSLSIAALAPALSMSVTSCGNSKICTVTFDSNGGSEVSTLQVLSGTKIVSPTPTRDGYNFAGWTVGEGESKQAFDFNQPITTDIKLTADWTKSTVSILLYANDGTFTSGETTTYKIISNITAGTKLSEITGYVTPTPTTTGNTFAYWLDMDGYKYTGDTVITESLVLGAQYQEKASGDNYAEATWAQMVAKTKDALTFVQFFFASHTEITTEDAAIEFLNKEIRTNAQGESTTLPDKEMKITLQGNEVTTKVRLIGVGFDKQYESTQTKTLFTFEFTDSLVKTRYTLASENNHVWYSEDEEGNITECFLRYYCNNVLLNCLPASVVLNAQKVSKITNTPKTDSGEQRSDVTSPEVLFPLSLNEYGIVADQNRSTFDLSDELKATVTYPYYRFAANDKVTISSKLKKAYAVDSGEYPSFWVRTPISTYPESGGCAHKVYYINSNSGTTDRVLARTDGYTVAPAFCL